MRDRYPPDDPEGNAQAAMHAAAFSRQVLARLDRHRRRRRRIHAMGGVAAILVAGAATAFLPALPMDPASPGLGDIMATMGLVAACCVGWLLADGRST